MVSRILIQVPEQYKDDAQEFFFRMISLKRRYMINLMFFLLQLFIFIFILIMLIISIFVMPSKPIQYGYFAWFKHTFFILYWISNYQIRKKVLFYSLEVTKAQREFEHITDSRIVIQNIKSTIIFYFKKEDYMELSRDSNVTQKHLQIYRFVSKSENDLDSIIKSEKNNTKPVLSERIDVRILLLKTFYIMIIII